MTLEVMCLYAQPPRGLWLQMLCTKPHPRSHGVLSGYITLLNASFAIRHGPLSPCCQDWDSLPHCSVIPAVHSAGRQLQGHRLLRQQTLSGRFDFRIREPFSLPRNAIQNISCSLSILFSNAAKANFILKAQVILETPKEPRCF